MAEPRIYLLLALFAFDFLACAFFYVAVAHSDALGFGGYTQADFANYSFSRSLVDIVLFSLLRSLVHAAQCALHGWLLRDHLYFVFITTFVQVGLSIAKVSLLSFDQFSSSVVPFAYLLFAACFILPLIESFVSLHIPNALPRKQSPPRSNGISEHSPLLSPAANHPNNSAFSTPFSINSAGHTTRSPIPDDNDIEEDNMSWSSDRFFMPSDEGFPVAGAAEELALEKDLRSSQDAAALQTLFTQGMEKIEHLYRKGHISKACKLLNTCRNALKYHQQQVSLSSTLAERSERVLQLAHIIPSIAALFTERKLRHNMIEHEAAMIKLFLTSAIDDEGWTLQSDDGSIRVWYKHREGTPVHAIRVEGTVEAPIVNLLVVGTELDIIASWFPKFTFPFKIGLRESVRVANVSHLHHLTYIAADVPWPFANRDMVINVAFEDRIDEDGTVAIVFETVAEYCDASLPEVPESFVRMDMSGGLVFRWVNEDSVQVQMVWEIDPKIAVVPAAVINFFTKKVLHYALQLYVKIATNIDGTAYAQRLQTEPLYGEIEKRFCERHVAIETAHAMHQQARSQQGSHEQQRGSGVGR